MKGTKILLLFETLILIGQNNVFTREKIKCIINDNGLKQLIKDYTISTKDLKTLIDYVITNVENITFLLILSSNNITFR